MGRASLAVRRTSRLVKAWSRTGKTPSQQRSVDWSNFASTFSATRNDPEALTYMAGNVRASAEVCLGDSPTLAPGLIASSHRWLTLGPCHEVEQPRYLIDIDIGHQSLDLTAFEVLQGYIDLPGCANDWSNKDSGEIELHPEIR